MGKKVLLPAMLIAFLGSSAWGAPQQRLEVPFKIIWYSPSSSSYIYSTFTVLLWNDIAPTTTDNFMKYLQYEAWSLSMIHRSADTQEGSPFVVQMGGYWASEDADKTVTIHNVAAFDPIQNEFNPDTMSNVRGTLAMARTRDLNSASSEWFVNLSDNLFLDDPQSPYAVFGQVVTTAGNTGMKLLDSVAALPVFDFSQAGTDPSHYALSELPVVNYQQWQYDLKKPLGLQNLLLIDPILSQATWRTVGDMDRDGKLLRADVDLLAELLNDPSFAYRELGDVNSDGKLNAADLADLEGIAQLGDMNLDGAVNGLDIGNFVRAVTGSQVDNAYKADMNEDGSINAQDISSFISALTGRGGAAGASVSVPEPATAGILGLAVFALWGGHRTGRDARK